MPTRGWLVSGRGRASRWELAARGLPTASVREWWAARSAAWKSPSPGLCESPGADARTRARGSWRWAPSAAPAAAPPGETGGCSRSRGADSGWHRAVAVAGLPRRVCSSWPRLSACRTGPSCSSRRSARPAADPRFLRCARRPGSWRYAARPDPWSRPRSGRSAWPPRRRHSDPE